MLKRIVGIVVYRGLNTGSNNCSAITLTTDNNERISYDANGNILKYLRNGTTAGSRPLEMDSLNYAYNRDGSGNLTNNRLRHVKDAVSTSNYLKEDIDNQGNDNYTYDEIGNLIGDTQAGVYNIKWNVYGKIKSLNRTTEVAVDTNSGSTTVEAVYHYDANGNRIGKIEGRYPGPHKATWYVRDAQGNVMAVYEKVAWGIAEGQAKLTEHHVYGSSRLGIIKRDQDIDQPKETAVNIDLLGPTYLSNFKRGNKFFELSNHLGNVLVTVSDKHSGVDTSSDGEYDYYEPNVVSASDYYPFGMQMVGRVSETAKYRYGFNGKEKDPEVMGEGNVYDYGFRIYNPRVGRFLSVDPLMQSYPWYTPYQYAGNMPISAIDLDGLEPVLPNLFRAGGGLPRLGRILIADEPPIVEVPIETAVPKPSPTSNFLRWLWRGQEVHKEQQAKWAEEGFKVEQSLGKYGRADGIKRVGENGIIRELKSDTKFGKSTGKDALLRYLQGAKEKYPDIKNWNLELHLYRSVQGLFYTVQKGDNLSVIAERFGIDLEDLKAINNYNDKNADLIKIGEVLLVNIGVSTINVMYQANKSIDNTRNSNKIRLTKEELEKNKKSIKERAERIKANEQAEKEAKKAKELGLEFI